MKNKFFGHLGMVVKHRFEVFKLCCKCGLFWRGLVHDFSKFSPQEFFESVKYYTGTHSPISECRKQKGYSNAWIHHKNNNKHHAEYWYDPYLKEQVNIPYKYAVESVCDRIAATKCYHKKTYKSEMVLDYFNKHDGSTYVNERMSNFFKKVFTDLVDKGEKGVLNKRYLKKTYNEIVMLKLSSK